MAIRRSRCGGAGAVRWSRCGGRRLLLVVWVGDAELGGVLVLSLVGARVNNQLDAVAGWAISWLEAGGWSPDVFAVVLGALNNDVLDLQVGCWSLEKDEGNWALGGRLPGNGEALASWDERVQARLRDWVALRDALSDVNFTMRYSPETHLWLGANWGGVCGGEGHHAGQTGREEAEEREVGHFVLVFGNPRDRRGGKDGYF